MQSKLNLNQDLVNQARQSAKNVAKDVQGFIDVHTHIGMFGFCGDLSKDDVEKTITFVKDRPGHDRRYAIDCTKIKKELGWQRKVTFEEGLLHTIKWYLKNTDWIDNILSGEYRNWIENNYDKR